MARIRPSDGWQRLMTAALLVYSRSGSRLGIREVSKEMGVSPATIYGYVPSKEALLYWLMRHALDPKADPPRSLPAAEPSNELARREIQELAEQAMRLPDLEALLAQPGPDARVELLEVLERIYDSTERTAALVSGIIIDARRDPGDAGQFFGDLRHRLLEQLRLYIELRVADGSFAPVVDSRAAAHLVVQVAAWFARDRHGDPEGSSMPNELARTTATSMLARALLANGGT